MAINTWIKKNFRWVIDMTPLTMSYTALLLSFLMLIVPLGLSSIFGLKLEKNILWAAFRMSLQLLMIGIFLKYLFEFNHPFLNVGWLILMIITAVFATVKNSALSLKKILLPTFITFSLSTTLVVLYLNSMVLRLGNILDARYLIVLGGMILGNALQSNIIGIGTFYKNIKEDEKHYFYILSLGAGPFEARLPYMQRSISLALRPTLAAMATMGIVALPGMMTGVILGGADPNVAIRYQIMIMLAILTSTSLSVIGTILMTMKSGFDKNGVLKTGIFK